jgi:hypothetical protein
MKKITLAFILFLSVNFSFSQVAAEYLSGLNGPTKMTLDGTTIYVNGWEDIYTINTSASSPSANLIYTLPADFYAYKTQKLGNNLFILVENWIESTDTFVGMQIVKLDVTNIGAGTQTVISSSDFIASFALVGNTMYYSREIETAPDVYSTNIYSFDATQSSPTSTLEYANIGLNDEAVDDVEVYNNVLYISSGGAEKILKFDLSSSTAVPEEYLNAADLNFNKGIFITSTGYMYVTNAHEIEKIDVNNSAANFEFIGSQTTYQDSYNGNLFLANFRDVVLVGDKLYMTLEEQGKVLTLTDATLGIPNFSGETLKMYPNPITSDLFLVNNTDFNEFELFDTIGKKVNSGSIDSNTINFDQLNTGIYFLNLKGNNKQNTFKIVKK